MKIALLGAAPSSKDLAPFHDMSWEIWACSPPNFMAPRVDAWFELHSLDRKMGHKENAPYINVIANHARVYITQPHPHFPNAILFPFDRMLEKYGPYFFKSSLSWMMAFAIEMKPEKIGLWGVDMAAHEEYADQRPGCHFFIMKALEAGIDVYAPPESDILEAGPLYGIKEFTRDFWKDRAREQELQARLENTRNHMERLKTEERVFLGALDNMQYRRKTWMDDGKGYRVPLEGLRAKCLGNTKSTSIPNTEKTASLSGSEVAQPGSMLPKSAAATAGSATPVTLAETAGQQS